MPGPQESSSEGLGTISQAESSENFGSLNEPGSSGPNPLELHPDDPLSDHVPDPEGSSANQVSQTPEDTTKEYVPWFPNSTSVGILSKTLLVVTMASISIIFALASVSGLSVIWNRVVSPGFLYCAPFFATLSVSTFQWLPIMFYYLSQVRPHESGIRQQLIRSITLFSGIIIIIITAGAYFIYLLNVTKECTVEPVHQDCLGDSSFYSWETGQMPTPNFECQLRVTPEQASLFTAETYAVQFARTYRLINNFSTTWREAYGDAYSIAFNDSIYLPFNMQRAEMIWTNGTLCNQGFSGNTDLYGLGIRCGVYLQWASSLLANNFLSNTRQETQKIYLVFSLAICLATLIASFNKVCIFGIEIEILYWMYWGGFVCVFGSAPCSIRIGHVSKWVQVDWTGVILFFTHWIMTYHGIWFIWYGYDQTFSRMPCGTYHFLFAPVFDPSVEFWALRDWLTMLFCTAFAVLLLTFPVLGLLLIPEVNHALQNSELCQAFFNAQPASLDGHLNSFDASECDKRHSIWLQTLRIIWKFQGKVRECCGLPAQRRVGIRLVTPVDVKDRRMLRIRWAATGLLTWVLTIVAIELTLKWNKVTEIYSISGTGQYVALIVGVGSFVSVCWSLVKQEAERKRLLQCQQVVEENGEGFELENLSNAISNAFTQPDGEFLSNDGAFPNTMPFEEAEPANNGI